MFDPAKRTQPQVLVLGATPTVKLMLEEIFDPRLPLLAYLRRQLQPIIRHGPVLRAWLPTMQASTKMPTALLLDLDDTLIDDRQAMSLAVQALISNRELARGQSPESLAKRWDEVGRAGWARYAADELTFAEQRR